VRKLPEAFETIRRDHPEVLQAYEALASAAHDAGPLDERTRRLVKLAIAGRPRIA
jgi:alkylhydroperoxidase/carboxymuconolactone decarboxylase family protein YurZ